MSRVVVSLRVAATPERAFGAFVDDIGACWQPNDLFRFTTSSPGVLAFEPRLGGRFTETFVTGEVFEIGRITVWEPGTRVAPGGRRALLRSRSPRSRSGSSPLARRRE